MKNILLSAVICALAIGNLAAQDWTPLSSGTTVSLIDVRFVDESNGFVVGESGTVLKTSNGGTSWEDVSPSGLNVTLNAVWPFDSQTAIIAGGSGVMQRTTDGGATWTAVSSGVRDELLALSFAGNDGICGGRALDILSSSDAGASWEFIDGGYFCGSNYGAFQLDALSAYVVGDNCIFQPLVQWTNDGGATWNFAVFYLNGNEGTLHDVFFHDVNNGFAVSNSWTGEGGVSRTVDGGNTWTTTLYPDALYGLDFPSAGVGYTVGYNGSILRSDDGGLSWSSEASGTSVWLRAVDFTDGETGYAVGDGGTILKRGGIGGGIPCEDIGPFQAKCKIDRSVHARIILPNSTAHAGEEIVFGIDGTEYPVVIETNGTHSRALLSVADQEPGLHTVTLEEPAGCFDPIVVFCDSTRPELAGDWTNDWGTGVRDELLTGPAELPARTALVGNYPNPFNPSTTITYELGEDTRVTMEIYNTVGQRIRTLVDQFQRAGVRSVEWNGVDETGRELSSGLYFYLLRTGTTVLWGKMMLLK